MKIVKNVPLPGAQRASKYPFYSMEVGDSVLIAEGDSVKARTAAYTHGSRYGKRFAARKIENGMRIWRTQ